MEHKGTADLQTERLSLRRFRLEDAEKMYENWATDERVTRFLNWTPYENMDDLRSFLSATISSYTDKEYYHWVITFEGAPVGSISALLIDEKNRLCEVGYCIGFDYWNKGITTEALKAVIHFLFNEVHFHRIYAKHDIENPGSGRVMEKCNMIHEGTLRKHYRRYDGTYSDAKIYGIVIDDYII